LPQACRVSSLHLLLDDRTDSSHPQSIIDIDSLQEDIDNEPGETDEQKLSKFHITYHTTTLLLIYFIERLKTSEKKKVATLHDVAYIAQITQSQTHHVY
jgi:hypothetical protein